MKVVSWLPGLAVAGTLLMIAGCDGGSTITGAPGAFPFQAAGGNLGVTAAGLTVTTVAGAIPTTPTGALAAGPAPAVTGAPAAVTPGTPVSVSVTVPAGATDLLVGVPGQNTFQDVQITPAGRSRQSGPTVQLSINIPSFSIASQFATLRFVAVTRSAPGGSITAVSPAQDIIVSLNQPTSPTGSFTGNGNTTGTGSNTSTGSPTTGLGAFNGAYVGTTLASQNGSTVTGVLNLTVNNGIISGSYNQNGTSFSISGAVSTTGAASFVASGGSNATISFSGTLVAGSTGGNGSGTLIGYGANLNGLSGSWNVSPP